MEALVISCNSYWVWSGMLRYAEPSPKKMPISLEKVELFCLFIAFSYTSMEAATF